MRLSDYVMDRLEEVGVKSAFLVTGRGSLYLSDALARNKNITSISTHHEQSAGYAAIAAAKFEPIGVCILSTGCGATNAISAALSAWQDEIPVLFISGQNSLNFTTRFKKSELRTYGEQETDIIELVAPITKYAVMLEDPTDIAFQIDKLLMEATTGRRGPVWLDIPLDLQSANVDPETLNRHKPAFQQLDEVANDANLQLLLDALERVERPVVVFGQGINRFSDSERTLSWLSSSKIPVVFDSSAPDFLPSCLDNVIGAVGAMGCTRAANFTIQNSDLVVFIGSQVRTSLTGENFEWFARQAEIFVLDVDKSQLRPEVEARSSFIELTQKTADTLFSYKVKSTKTRWLQTAQRWKDVFPSSVPSEDQFGVNLYDLAEILSDVMPPEVNFITDSGLVELILPTNIRFSLGQRVIHPYSQGAMGFALPAAVGAAAASSSPAITVIGDGSIMMNIQELQTIRHLNLNVKILVIENDAYAIIRKRQKELFRNRTIGTDKSNGVSCPEFQKVASSFDIPYFFIESTQDLKREIANILEVEGPLICEIRGLQSQQYLRTARALLESGASLPRPLEDQEPFMPREMLEREMIIESINLR